MKVVVVGCGRLGSELANGLSLRKHDVSVIDNAPAAFSNLSTDFKGKVVEGDAMNQDVLLRAGIDNVDAVAAITNSDALNLVVGRVAKDIFNVPRVVARNYDPVYRGLYDTFGLQVVSSIIWGAQRVEEMIYPSDIRIMFSAGNGEIEIYEVIIPQEWEGQTIEAFIPCDECNIAAITRAGRAWLPAPSTQLKEGDILNISATFNGIEALREKLHRQKEGE